MAHPVLCTNLWLHDSSNSIFIVHLLLEILLIMAMNRSVKVTVFDGI